MAKVDSYQAWKDDLARHGSSPEELVQWARENVSEEYAQKLERIILESEHPAT